MNAILIMDDGVEMKIMKIGYVLLIGIAAFLSLPAHGEDSDSAALRKCIDIDDEMTIHYNCEEPATVEFCYEDIVMKPNAADIDIKLAKGLLCKSGDGFHDPCHFYGPGKCHNIEFQAWANRIAGYRVVYGVCPEAGESLRWVSNPGSNGEYACGFAPVEGIESDDDSDGSTETLSEDDLYERLFGDYEDSLSALLDGDLSSAEILGILLVELLGGELSFEDALGNIGRGQEESGDQGKEQVASGDQGSKQRYPAGKEFQDCDTCPKMVAVPPGTFLMGAPSSEESSSDAERPQHRVTISNPFAVGKYEVTREQFEKFVEATGYDASSSGCWTDREGGWQLRQQDSWRKPGFSQSEDHPVVCVNWNDAQAYVSWLSRKTGEQYRLLSESEWEYVARAGTTGPFHFGSTISTDQANYDGYYTYGGGPEGIYRKKTVAVGSFAANSFGLHDVHGNVWEWVEDCWHEDYHGAPQDGSAWVTGGDCGRRVVRGGTWGNYPRSLRSANRFRVEAGGRLSQGGFRVARTFTP